MVAIYPRGEELIQLIRMSELINVNLTSILIDWYELI